MKRQIIVALIFICISLFISGSLFMNPRGNPEDYQKKWRTNITDPRGFATNKMITVDKDGDGLPDFTFEVFPLGFTNVRIEIANINALLAEKVGITINRDISVSDWYPFSNIFTLSNPGLGTNTVRLSVQFKQGGISKVESKWYAVATNIATNTVFLINNGALTATNTNVILTIACMNVDRMRIANNSNITNASWEAYMTNRSWGLQADGTTNAKTVYIQFSNTVYASASSVVTASISPCIAAIVSMQVNGGNPFTTNTNVSYTFAATNAQVMMVSSNSNFSGASWTPIISSSNWQLTASDGANVIFAMISNIYFNTAAQVGPFSIIRYEDALYVSTNGKDTNYGIKTSPMRSINDAIQRAVLMNLKNIAIGEGEYTPGQGLSSNGTSGVFLTNSGMRLNGGFDSNLSLQTGMSTFNASGLSSLIPLVISNVSDIAISSIAITRARNAPGMKCITMHNSLITNCILSNNTNTPSGGGGLFLLGNSNTFSIRATGNYAWLGGGVYVTSGTNNVFTGRIDHNGISYYAGGGIFIGNSCRNKVDCQVDFNYINGVYLINGQSNEVYGLVYNNISTNYANNGCGIVLNKETYSYVDSIVEKNLCTNGYGAIELNSATNCIIAGTITNNTGYYGGGIYVGGQSISNMIIGVIRNNSNYGIEFSSALTRSNNTVIMSNISGNIPSDITP